MYPRQILAGPVYLTNALIDERDAGVTPIRTRDARTLLAYICFHYYAAPISRRYSATSHAAPRLLADYIYARYDYFAALAAFHAEAEILDRRG